MSGLFVTIFSKVWKTTVVAQKATVATKLARVNSRGGNLELDCLSQGAQGVSIPRPKVITPAPTVANPPIKSNVLIDALSAVRLAVIMSTTPTQ